MTVDHSSEVLASTAWLREQPDLISARIGFLLSAKGVDPKTLICAKIFPDRREPTGGAVVTPQGMVFQFTYNLQGMIIERTIIDEWINITQTYQDHPWRDEILTALAWREKSL
jgi:YD repeat-containing protein